MNDALRVPGDVVAALDRRPGRALMLGHVHPDADVLGTLLAIGEALRTRGWSVVAGGPHPAPGALSFLPGVEGYEVLKTLDGPFDVVVLTDCPNPDRTEGLIDAAKRASPMVVNIDHHPDNRRYGTIDWVDVDAAATGEMVYRLLTAVGAPLTPSIATNLFTAVHTDTGSFRYSNTTPRTFRIAAELTAAGADPSLVSDRLYQQRAPDSLVQLGEVLRLIQVSEDGRIAWLAVPRGLVSREFLDAEDLVGYPRSVGGVKVAVLLREEGPGTIKASLRAKGDVPVNAIAHRFGGGGHENAAGCTLSGTLEEATATLLEAVRDSLDAVRPRSPK